MTNAQLKDLLRWAARYVARENARLRLCYRDPRTKRIQPSAVAREIAKGEMWLSKARKAVARGKACVRVAK